MSHTTDAVIDANETAELARHKRNFYMKGYMRQYRSLRKSAIAPPLPPKTEQDFTYAQAEA